MQLPEFLPELVCINGTWENILNLLYEIFRRDFVDHTQYLESKPIDFDRRKIDSDKEEGFWHLITKGSGNRLFNPRRAERLPWVRSMIENYLHSSIRYWDYCESLGRVRTYIWLYSHDFVIVLEKRETYIFLITAYYIEYPHQRRNVQKKFIKRI